MKLTAFQIQVLRSLRMGGTPLGRDFNTAWEAFPSLNALPSYEGVMDIRSPLIDQVHAHLVAQTLLGETE